MDDELIRRARRALLLSWSATSSSIFDSEMHPSYGQCAQTAIVIQEKFGGDILRTHGWPPNGRHFYNRIDGERIDFTVEQFCSNPRYAFDVCYEDVLSNAAEAQSEASPAQVSSLRLAFAQAFNQMESE
jgi:hypothetical protein